MNPDITRQWECTTCGQHFDTFAQAQAHHGQRRGITHQVAYCGCHGWAGAA